MGEYHDVINGLKNRHINSSSSVQCSFSRSWLRAFRRREFLRLTASRYAAGAHPSRPVAEKKVIYN
uniref:Uncharacterized protein n=1 Tax=Anopheles minimus TaxID=112268 RepID=A0A182WJ03_9DIPT